MLFLSKTVYSNVSYQRNPAVFLRSDLWKQIKYYLFSLQSAISYTFICKATKSILKKRNANVYDRWQDTNRANYNFIKPNFMLDSLSTFFLSSLIKIHCLNAGMKKREKKPIKMLTKWNKLNGIKRTNQAVE